jgi:ATP-dependent Clp protease protease subunit
MYDTMQFVTPDISTICTGIAASMAAVLMAAGSHGKRTALKHSRIMIHQPSGGAMGQASDIEITVNEVRKLKKELYDILSFHTGQTPEQVAIDSDRDKWMTATEAKDYGLVDEVLFINARKERK